MSNTPRTDAVRDLPCSGIEKAVALTQHARELERECAELRDALTWLSGCVQAAMDSPEAAQHHYKDVEHAMTRADLVLHP